MRNKLKAFYGKYWRRRVVRIFFAVLILASAIFIEYRFAKVPLPVDVEKSTPSYTPVSAELVKQEELIIVNPSRIASDNSSIDIPPDVLFLNKGNDFVTVDVHFEAARFGEDVIDRLRRDPQQGPLPPAGLQQITYTTAGDEDGRRDAEQIGPTEPCRTAIYITLAQGTTYPKEIHFLQADAPGSAHYHYFDVRVVGADVIVQLITRNSASSLGEMHGPGCSKIFSVGNNGWMRTFSSPLAQSVFVPDGAAFRFSFTTDNADATWPAGKAFEALQLDACPLNAYEIHKTTRQGGPAETPVFSAWTVEVDQPLILRQLLVGSDQLQLDFSGKAMVQEAGKYAKTFDLLEFGKHSPLFAALLGMLNLALLEWLRRIVFSNKRKKNAAGFVHD